VRLDVSEVPAGGHVEVRCSRPGCPFRTRSVQPRGGRTRLAPLFGRRWLRPGVAIEIRVLAPDHIGKVVRYTMRPGKLPATQKLCLPPGAPAPRRC
jgi:hypothetical protein